MRKQYIYFFIINFLFLVKFSQGIAQTAKFEKTFGTPNGDYGYKIINTKDKGFVLGSTINSRIGITKFDSLWNVQWTKTYDNSWMEITDVIESKNGDLILLGYAVISALDNDIVVIRTDNNGNLLWSKLFDGSYDDKGNEIIETQSNDLLIVGTTYSSNHGEILFLKLDSSGVVIWSNTYGETGFQDEGYNLIQLADNNYVIAGYWGTDSLDMAILKIDQSGAIIWAYLYGGDNIEKPEQILETRKHEIIVMGNSYSFGLGHNSTANILLLNLDSLGTINNSKIIEGQNNDFGTCMKLSGENILLGGYTRSITTNYDAFLLNFGINDSIHWINSYGDQGTSADYFYSICTTSKNDIVMTGYTHGFGTGTPYIYLVNLDSSGISGCQMPVTQLKSKVCNAKKRNSIFNTSNWIFQESQFSPVVNTITLPENTVCINTSNKFVDLFEKVDLFPNPTNGELKIRFHDKIIKHEYFISIIDLFGNIVFGSVFQENDIYNLNNLTSGIYCYKISDVNGMVKKVGKIVIAH